MAKRAFGELEAEILSLLRPGERKTVKDIHQALGGDSNYNTVMTVMSRLAEKKKLGRERSGLQYEYWLIDLSDSFSLLNKLKQKFSRASSKSLVCHLLESSDDLAIDDLEEIEKVLQKMREAKK